MTPLPKTFCSAPLLAVLVGCRSDFGDVHGRVTKAGQPVTGLVLHFLPAKGPEAQAALDEAGNYHLITPGTGAGAVIGKHRVYFVEIAPEKEEEAKQNLSQQDYIAGKLPRVSRRQAVTKVPAKYLSPDTSELVCEVRAGSNEFNVELAD